MQNEDTKTATLFESAGRSHIVIPSMLVLAALFNVAALMTPFYTAKLFSNPPYTFTLPYSVLTYFVLFTLILCPFLHIVGLMIMWAGRLKPEFSYRIERLLHVISIFNMLDVFCLALFIFITEGGALIMTEAKSGLYLLLIFLFGAYLIPIIIKGTHKNYLQYIKQPIKTVFGYSPPEVRE